MLREPRPTPKAENVRKDVRKGRFQVKPLEERIAPSQSKFGHTDNGNHYGQNK